MKDIITPPFTEGQKKVFDMTKRMIPIPVGQIDDIDDIITGADAVELVRKAMERMENIAETNSERTPETDLAIHRENLLLMHQIQFNEIGFYKYKASKEVDPRWKDAFLEQAKRAEGFARALQCAISILCEKIDGEVQNE